MKIKFVGVFFDLVLISSVLTTLYIYCSILDFIDRTYLVKKKKERNIEVPLFKRFFANQVLLSLKKLWFKTFGTFVLIFGACNPLWSSKL